MKLIIAGSRTITLDENSLDGIINVFQLRPDEIVSGCAKGIDSCGENYAYRIIDYGHKMSLMEFPADWEKHGKAAGHIRNKQMAEYSDALLLIWDGQSKGSANMKENMLKLNKPVYEVIIKSHNTNKKVESDEVL